MKEIEFEALISFTVEVPDDKAVKVMDNLENLVEKHLLKMKVKGNGICLGKTRDVDIRFGELY